MSAFRISRDRWVKLPPTFIVCLPATRVTLSKNWKSFWLVMSGWLPFAPRFRMPPLLNMIWLIADVVVAEIDARNPDRLRDVGAVVDRAS